MSGYFRLRRICLSQALPIGTQASRQIIYISAFDMLSDEALIRKNVAIRAFICRAAGWLSYQTIISSTLITTYLTSHAVVGSWLAIISQEHNAKCHAGWFRKFSLTQIPTKIFDPRICKGLRIGAKVQVKT